MVEFRTGAKLSETSFPYILLKQMDSWFPGTAMIPLINGCVSEEDLKALKDEHMPGIDGARL